MTALPRALRSGLPPGPFWALFWALRPFCLSQALRDVYLGHVFQDIDFFAVILVAFTLSTLVFGVITAIRAPAQFKMLRDQIPTVLAMNATTALAWSCYFFALTHLEPAIVNTVHSGMGPLTVLALAACGVRLAKPGAIGRGELWSYGGDCAGDRRTVVGRALRTFRPARRRRDDQSPGTRAADGQRLLDHDQPALFQAAA